MSEQQAAQEASDGCNPEDSQCHVLLRAERWLVRGSCRQALAAGSSTQFGWCSCSCVR